MSDWNTNVIEEFRANGGAVASGLAMRLWYQSGFVGAPPLEATTT